MRRLVKIPSSIICVALILAPVAAAMIGKALGPGILHPANLNPNRIPETNAMLARTGARKEDFEVKTADGVILQGWKVKPTKPNGDWVLLYHGLGDNRTGMLGQAEFLLRHGYSVVMTDARAHGAGGVSSCTYGWLERYDTVAITDALYASEKVRYLYALGVSLGAAVALQSAALEPRIEAVAGENSVPSGGDDGRAGSRKGGWIQTRRCFAGKGCGRAGVSGALDLRHG